MTKNAIISSAAAHPSPRLASITQARQALLQTGQKLQTGRISPWVERSWQRCLALGLKPRMSVAFDQISAARARSTQEANQHLASTARPLLENLARAIVNTRYFAILTNAEGVVVDACGAIDRSDTRATQITRVGTDLCEHSIGTTAIGTALSELQPVWVHRGEHFFEATSVYSCAGAPLFGPDGACIGILDVTGVDVQERRELKHLVRQSACKIENAMVLAQKHSILLRLNWPGNPIGHEADGLVCLDEDGWIKGANRVARQMVSDLTSATRADVHINEVFGLPIEQLFDASKRPDHLLELPLWSGLRLQAQAIAHTDEANALPATSGTVPLRDVEAAMIRKAVDDTGGNISQAARMLGIGRATLYRKLGQRAH
ncbi:helix-turn-helix domain-containing protein [Rhodoferax sp.]|uniref:helix-turn-helix domain-containing protein n=1 Tax=Rhodoferax sp. TaxID=50421 RepID=UPI002842A099|nr:helix-turn-helix domain-containing protein [Rhodoferax sp.]MDR3370670.1 helix-turn-helix domain-containing protein [Rhodoferax sp.]